MRPGGQRVVAETMKGLMESEGDRIKFIVNEGDSFYCDGVGEADTDLEEEVVSEGGCRDNAPINTPQHSPA